MAATPGRRARRAGGSLEEVRHVELVVFLEYHRTAPRRRAVGDPGRRRIRRGPRRHDVRIWSGTARRGDVGRPGNRDAIDRRVPDARLVTGLLGRYLARRAGLGAGRGDGWILVIGGSQGAPLPGRRGAARRSVRPAIAGLRHRRRAVARPSGGRPAVAGAAAVT